MGWKTLKSKNSKRSDQNSKGTHGAITYASKVINRKWILENFSFEFWNFFKNTFYTEHPPAASSVSKYVEKKIN